MKTKAAILRGIGQDWEVTELDLDPPKTGELLIRYVAAGLCHSDEHLRHGDLVPPRFPVVGGHEGAGIIEEVGPGVTRYAPGDGLRIKANPSANLHLSESLPPQFHNCHIFLIPCLAASLVAGLHQSEFLPRGAPVGGISVLR